MKRIRFLAMAAMVVLGCSASSGDQTMVSVSIHSDGATITGRFFLADANGDRPTVLLIPGWPSNPQDGLEDVLGLGGLLRDRGVNVLMIHPRGMFKSEGTTSFANALEDIKAAFDWLKSPQQAAQYAIDTTRMAIAGHSWGGGVALAYAARDPRVRRVASVAGTDHGAFIREFDRNPEMARMIGQWLSSTAAPAGPVKFDLTALLEELRQGQAIYGLRENASALADRQILLVGGWEDRSVTIEDQLLPLYRALRAAGAEQVMFVVYYDKHGFAGNREQIADEIANLVK